MVANLYAVWATLIPASVLLGIAAAPNWVAKSTYLTQLGHKYAALSSVSADEAISRFFGIFCMAFESGACTEEVHCKIQQLKTIILNKILVEQIWFRMTPEGAFQMSIHF